MNHRTSKTRGPGDPGSWMDQWGACKVCGGEIPQGHFTDCEVFEMQREIERLARELKVEKAVNDLAYIPHRNLVESRDGLQKRYDKAEAERDRLRAALEDVRGFRLATQCGIDPLRAAGMRNALDITREIADKALSGEPTSVHETCDNEGEWVIVYADQDRLDEHFSGAGARAAAEGRFRQLTDSWTCRLFRCVAKTGYRHPEKASAEPRRLPVDGPDATSPAIQPSPTGAAPEKRTSCPKHGRQTCSYCDWPPSKTSGELT